MGTELVTSVVRFLHGNTNSSSCKPPRWLPWLLSDHIQSGALCSVWGIVMFIFLPDSPVSAPGLSQRQRRIAVERLKENQTGVENKHIKPRQILEAFMDYKLYFFFVLGAVCESQLVYMVWQPQTDLMSQATSPTAASRTSEPSSSKDLGSLPWSQH